jgi:uncharacterized Zn-finger protein
MAETPTPYLVNDIGSENIRVGVKKLMCMGATPPNDHPHVFLDMGAADTVICPYCSTLYVYDEELATEQTDPPHCIFSEKAA